MLKIIILIITMSFSTNAYSDDESFAPKGSELYNYIINEKFSESLKYFCKSNHTEFTISVLEGDVNDKNYKSGLLMQEDGLFTTVYTFSISERRWSWNTRGNSFAFIVKANEGMYYDFSTKREKVAPSAYFTCTKIDLAEPVESIETSAPSEIGKFEYDDSFE